MHISPPTGSVSLVGAGPGDPDLLTVRATELIRSAEVVVTEVPGHADLLRELGVVDVELASCGLPTGHTGAPARVPGLVGGVYRFWWRAFLDVIRYRYRLAPLPDDAELDERMEACGVPLPGRDHSCASPPMASSRATMLMPTPRRPSPRGAGSKPRPASTIITEMSRSWEPRAISASATPES